MSQILYCKKVIAEKAENTAQSYFFRDEEKEKRMDLGLKNTARLIYNRNAISLGTC